MWLPCWIMTIYATVLGLVDFFHIDHRKKLAYPSSLTSVSSFMRFSLDILARIYLPIHIFIANALYFYIIDFLYKILNFLMTRAICIPPVIVPCLFFVLKIHLCKIKSLSLQAYSFSKLVVSTIYC